MEKLQMISGSICLSNIPAEAIKKGSDGKSYVNLAIIPMRQTDPYGNQFTCSCAPRQEERVEGTNYLIGKFRLPKPKDEAHKAPEPPAVDTEPWMLR